VIKPTVGRVVWFWDSALTAEDPAGEPLAAIIARVWSDTCVNLAVFDSNGTPTCRSSVTLYQDEGERPGGSHASWMPYQVGQAKRAEEIERQFESFLLPQSAETPASDPPPPFFPQHVAHAGYDLLDITPEDIARAASEPFADTRPPIVIESPDAPAVSNDSSQEPAPL
jgi:hypothetical protein